MDLRTRIELYTDKAGEHRWRKKAANYFITVAASQGYTRQTSAIRNLEREQDGTFSRDQHRHDLGVRVALEDSDRPFVKGKRRVGVLHRRNGQEIVVFELKRRTSA